MDCHETREILEEYRRRSLEPDRSIAVDPDRRIRHGRLRIASALRRFVRLEPVGQRLS